MLRRSPELVLSLVAIVFITIAYLLVSFIFEQYPASSSFFGHTLGILGFILMVLTETLYPLRKQVQNARWGNMSAWLQFHIFTGLVGPYMVLLHASWQFNGLAGVLTLLTLIIVVSGFIGRYIYTAIPRTPEGVEISLEELHGQEVRIETELVSTLEGWRAVASPSLATKTSQAGVESLTREKARIHNQIQTINNRRRMLAIWHVVHIPLGLALFTVAVLHIIAAIYYANLIR